ncbi:MAG: hypothetical protein ACFCUV_22345 [Rivularia sp. (in: cyanobacteria)]
MQALLKEEKEYFEGCNAERLEALNKAGLLEMEVKVLKRLARTPTIPESAIGLLQDALKLRANAGGAIKDKIREFLKLVI